MESWREWQRITAELQDTKNTYCMPVSATPRPPLPELTARQTQSPDQPHCATETATQVGQGSVSHLVDEKNI